MLACAAIGLLALSSCATAAEHATAFDAMRAMADEQKEGEPAEPERVSSSIFGGVIGAGTGFAAGVALAVAVTAANYSQPDDEGTPAILIAWMTYPLAGATVGAAVGALIGWGNDP